MSEAKTILFVHNNFPGQFGFIAEALMARGHRCFAIASSTGRGVPGVTMLRWQAKRGSTPGLFAPAVRAEADMIRGRAALECALALRSRGVVPDLIVGHPGWGETLFLREVFPEVPQILHGEFFYRTVGGDVGFDPEFAQELSLDERVRVHAKNMGMALAFTDAGRIVCPTAFQAGTLPSEFRSKASIIHEGVDTDLIAPKAGTRFKLADGRVLDATVPVITFINRVFEPLRGFHIFMRALPKVLAAVPEAHVVLIGADETHGYGQTAPAGATWKAHLLSTVGDRLDRARVHFTGRIPHDRMLAALSISSAHVYYTYPFVLSWSLLEAMASECLIIGSDTAPVREVIKDGENGRLLDFFDVDALADALIAGCRDRDAYAGLRSAARRTVVERFDRKRVCLPAWLDLVDMSLAGRKHEQKALPAGVLLSA